MRVNLLEKVQAEAAGLYDVYEVQVRFTDKIYGGTPRSLDAALAAAEAQARKKKLDPEYVDALKEKVRQEFAEGQQRAEAQRAVGEEPEEEEPIDKTWVTFQCDEEGIYFDSRCVKSGLRECMSKLGVFTTKKGSKGYHDYGLFIEPYKIRFLDEHNNPVPMPDGCDDRAGHVSGPTGKRAILRRMDFVEKRTMRFRIRRMAGGLLSEEALIRALAALQLAGLGGSRSQGFGQFELIACEKIVEGNPIKVRGAAE